MEQLVYVLVEISSGEVPIEIDTLNVFCNKEDAVKQLNKSFKCLTSNLKKYGTIDDEETYIDDDEYNVVFYDDNGTTHYYGEVREIKAKSQK